MENSCPVCKSSLSVEKGKLNLQVGVCALEHGAFVDPQSLGALLATETVSSLQALPSDRSDSVTCPNCSSQMREVALGDLKVDACSNCSGLWFDRGDLTQFSRDWRARAYGKDSFSSRADVMDETQKLYAAEIISGVLTEFEMSLLEDVATE